MQKPDAKPAAPNPPKADLGRLRIERGNEAVRSSPRGFPWLTLVALGGIVALGFLFREPIAGLFAGSSSGPLQTARAVKVVPGQAEQGDVSSNGYIVADRQASLATVLSGRLVELNAKEGDTVEKDSVVARIQFDDLEVQEQQALAAKASAEARLAQAKAQTATVNAQVVEAEKAHAAAVLTAGRLKAEVEPQRQIVKTATENRDQALREVERNKRLRQQEFINEAEWDAVQTAGRTAELALLTAAKRLAALEANVEAWAGQVAQRKAAWDVAAKAADGAVQAELVAQAAVSEADQATKLAGILLEKTRIRAPFTGLVIRKDAEKGEVISSISAGNSRGSVLTIIDPESMEVQVELSERRIARVKEGDRAMVFLDADPQNGLPAAVRKIWPRADRAKGSIEVRVKLDDIPAALRPDMAARVVFKGTTEVQPVGDPYVTIPKGAIARRSGSTMVFVVENGKARAVDITVGEARGTTVVVKQGLEGGELLVVDPPETLRSGDTVQTR